MRRSSFTPAESRLVDTANQYHLWCFAEPEGQFPFGYTDRLVLSPSNGGSVHQEPFEDENPSG